MDRKEIKKLKRRNKNWLNEKEKERKDRDW